MSDTVIKVENLGKNYIIGHQKPERYTSLRDVIAEGTRSVIGSLTQNSKLKTQNSKLYSGGVLGAEGCVF